MTEENVPLTETKPAQDGAQQTNARTGLLLASFGRIKEYAGSVFRQRKPWTELMDRTSFSRPENLAEATSRIRKNLAYFRINYVIVVLITLLVCIVMNPGSLIVLGILLSAWLYVFVIRAAPLAIAGRTVGDREKLMAMTAISFVTIFFLTSVGTVLFTALLLGMTVIALHGATRVPDDLFIDEGAAGSSSIWSILTGGSSATPPALSTNV